MQVWEKKQDIVKSQRVEYGGGIGGGAREGLARGAVGHKAVRKFRLGVNSGIPFQESCPLVVAYLLLCVSIYVFICIDHLPWIPFKQEPCFTILDLPSTQNSVCRVMIIITQ